MFSKSSKWWFGKNSIFGQAIGQTAWGSGGGGGNFDIPTNVDHSIALTDEQKLMFGGLLLFLVLRK